MIRLCIFCLLLPVISIAGNETVPPAIQLAESYESVETVTDFLVSEKLDGVRGRWSGTELLTRNGNHINAPAWFTAGWPAEPLDGELWIARERFEDVSGIARTTEPDDDRWREVRFMVFDLPAFDAPFARRAERIRELLDEAGVPWLRAIEQRRVHDIEELDALLATVTAQGGEGLMLHHQDAYYRAGRSDQLLKYKPHDDAEACVLAHLPGKGKYTGMTGSLLVARADGARFRVGSGLSDADRANPPPAGSWITYRYNGLTSGGLPRFPRFLRVRDDVPIQLVSPDVPCAIDDH